MATPMESPITAEQEELKTRLWSQLQKQRESSQRNGAPDYRKRLSALNSLLKALVERQEEFVHATSEDFGGRARQETLGLELFPLVDQIRHTRKHLSGWMKPRSVGTGLNY